MAETYQFFNDEWNKQQIKESDSNLPRMGRCLTDAITGKE